MQQAAFWVLIRKELTVEWRQHSALSGIFLYLVSTIFLSYLAFDGLVPVRSWNALFWIILLFAAINAILKAFIQEHEKRHLFYYSLVSPRDMINAKIIYNALLMMILSVAGLVIFIVFMGNPIEAPMVFLINMFLGMIGFSSMLCLVSAIAARARNNFTLMAVLGFPLVLPMLLLLIRVSGQSIEGITLRYVLTDLVTIILLIAVTFVLSNLLFPYIWRE